MHDAGISTPAVSTLTGVPRSTLHYWAETGLVSPSLRDSEGRRVTRWWSIPDVLLVRTIKALRDAGCPLQTVRSAQEVLAVWDTSMAQVVLYWDGGDVIALEDWTTLRSAIRKPGQQLLHVLAIPLAAWRRAAQDAAVTIDLDEFRRLRSKREARNSGASTASMRISSIRKTQR